MKQGYFRAVYMATGIALLAGCATEPSALQRRQLTATEQASYDRCISDVIDERNSPAYKNREIPEILRILHSEGIETRELTPEEACDRPGYRSQPAIDMGKVAARRALLSRPLPTIHR